MKGLVVIRDEDIEKMAGVKDRYQAADAIGKILFTDKSRFYSFRSAFLEGIEDFETGHWVEARGIGPVSIGYNLGAVWVSRH